MWKFKSADLACSSGSISLVTCYGASVTVLRTFVTGRNKGSVTLSIVLPFVGGNKLNTFR